MNVTCDKCGKKYVISDDKVAGKASVKIRCKQCQNLISVAVSAAPAAGGGAASSGSGVRSPWEDESTRAMPPLDTTAAWFAMLKGKQEGPFDLVALSRKVTAGELTLRTYLWKAGMADWKRAADVPEVSPIFAGVAVQSSPSPVPTRPPPPPRASRVNNPAVSDVALSNEVPAPGVSKSPSAQSGAGAVVQRQTKSQPLDDLFSGISNPDLQKVQAKPEVSTSQHEQFQPDAGDAGPGPSQENQAPVDPFAALSQGDGMEAPPPGEATRFFIAQAGVNKRNPPWKIALFVGVFIVAPVALLYVLNTLEFIKLPTVTRTNEDGQEVQESFFSAGGAAGLKDMLTGDAKKRRAEAEKAKAEREALARQRALAAGNRKGPDEPEVVAPKPQDPALAEFYAENERTPKGPRIRKGDDEGGAAVNQGGLSPETAMKVVADKSKAFTACIDNALRRNPNLAVGNITIVLTVAPSGAVKAAGVEPKKHELSDWAQCMITTGRRIVFPSSDGETQLELPFKVGVAVSP